ncbi:MAG: 2-oxo acid dehydrogenase subunit E2 [Pleurocapsa minor GSE-CHR-MK-17-07R]|jgi:pyruvate dehydrogenase E2 component (dihydrolipoamide acetyltransferase)|nr:2-oxo acid dehydrogenase subunit E2 [Pleurocapsa minor GSE-CHR-MK 17-07R]
MAVDILMPNLGFDTQTGRLIEWLKQPGEPVAKGEAIAVIESDKANVELESIAAGIVLAHLAAADSDVAIGAVIARVGTADEQVTVSAPAMPAASAPPPPSHEHEASRVSPVAQRLAQALHVDAEHVTGSGARGRVTRRDVEQAARQVYGGPVIESGADAHGIRALPKVRRAARERGIDLLAVRAAGHHNPITLEALDAFAAGQAQPERESATVAALPDGATLVPLTRMRQVIGRRLGDSMRDAPHFYVTGEFDFEAALARLGGVVPKVKINELLLYLTAQTLLRVPALNATFVEGNLYRYQRVHLAVAVARDDGLITPVLRDAQRYSLVGLAEELRALIERARANRLAADEVQGGTFTVSNMGMVQQVDHFTAVINPPQVAILAIGALKPRAVVREGGIFVRRTAHFTLSGDHRVVDGMDLARFMSTFQEELNLFAQTT